MREETGERDGMIRTGRLGEEGVGRGANVGERLSDGGKRGKRKQWKLAEKRKRQFNFKLRNKILERRSDYHAATGVKTRRQQ